jgi:uncharacterized membrane protein YjjB (DUF3815 family)
MQDKASLDLRASTRVSPQLELLAQAGRLLLQYNESAEEIQQALTETARSLSDEKCCVVISYGSISVSLGQEGPVLAPVKELRFNTTTQTRIHEILEQAQNHTIPIDESILQLNQAETVVFHHSFLLEIGLLAAAAVSLARLLGADMGAQAIAAISTALGLLARQELGRRNASVLVIPFAAAVVAGILGGVAMRQGWTNTTGLALVVPALVLVPGPHILNGLLDIIDNYVLAGIGRLTLAGGILVSTSVGLVVGVELILGQLPNDSAAANVSLSLVSDMILAGVASCGFAITYNTPWPHVALAAAVGMVGHGVRFLALDSNWRLDAATFLGGYSVGFIAACLARFLRTPVAVIAFAGAVTMMPGMQLYRALGGALQLAEKDPSSNSQALAEIVGNGLQGSLVAGALAIGVVAGVRTVRLVKSSWH